jgi:hypothetical protein
MMGKPSDNGITGTQSRELARLRHASGTGCASATGHQLRSPKQRRPPVGQSPRSPRASAGGYSCHLPDGITERSDAGGVAWPRPIV